MDSDSQGFLVGQLIDINREMRAGQREGLELLKGIRADLANLAPGTPQKKRKTAKASTPAGRSAPAAKSSPSVSIPAKVPAGRGQSAPAARARGADGRFLPGNAAKPSSGSGGKRPPRPGPSGDRSPSRFMQWLRGRGKDAAELGKDVAAAVRTNTDGIDPAVQALKEVKQAVSPLGRLLPTRKTPKEKRQEGWFKKVIETIKNTANRDVLTGKAGSGGIVTRILMFLPNLLGKIIGNTFGKLLGLGGSALSGAGGIAGRLVGAIGPLLMRIFAPVAVAWAGWKIGQWIGDKVYKWFVDSGLETKLFDWIDKMVKSWDDLVASVKNYVKEKFDGVKNTVTKPFKDFEKGWSGSNKDSKLPKSTAEKAGELARSATKSLGDLIGRHEGGYNSFNRGRAGDSKGQSMDFSNMTIGEVMRRQALGRGDPNRLFAVGKYQVIPETLKDAVSQLGISSGEKLTPELQDKIFNEYLLKSKRREVANYISGKSDNLEAAALALSKEWASVAAPGTGRSYYDKIGNNNASISTNEIRMELIKARSISMASASIPDTPSIDIPSMAGRGRTEPVQVNVRSPIGQNVQDRGIAHVVTGGLGGSGG